MSTTTMGVAQVIKAAIGYFASMMEPMGVIPKVDQDLGEAKVEGKGVGCRGHNAQRRCS